MIHAPVKAGLGETIRRTVVLEACAARTGSAAVPLTSIAGLADRERPLAPAAQQQVQERLRHQALGHCHPREEWTSGLGGAMLCPPTAVPILPRTGPLPAGASFSSGPDDIADPAQQGRGFAADDDRELSRRRNVRI